MLDDILVHFDDTRAAAAICVLGELGLRTQVLLFTHHERVVDIAERELAHEALAVVRLPARDHDQPPSSAALEGERALRSGRSGIASRGGLGAAEQAILAATRSAAGRALTKAELLERSGTEEAQWPTAIRSLVTSGLLVQEGQKRGARYRVPL